jgi:hypothetical protein
MRNFDQFQLQVEPVATAAATLNPDRHGLAHLTATQAFSLDAPFKAVLRAYMDRGGLLLLDAAGGSTEAPGAFERLLRELYPAMTIAPLTLDHPVYHATDAGGIDITSVDYRRSPNMQSVHIPRLRGATVDGRVVAIVSYEDLSGGLVGYTHAGLNGYTPASAADIMRNLILWRSSPTK